MFTDISQRTNTVLSQLPEVQHRVSGISYSASTAAPAYKQSEASHETQMFTPLSRPPSISARYNLSMNKIPKVHDMDVYLDPVTLQQVREYSHSLCIYCQFVFLSFFLVLSPGGHLLDPLLQSRLLLQRVESRGVRAIAATAGGER